MSESSTAVRRGWSIDAAWNTVFLGVIVSTVGLLVLLGWVIESADLKSISPTFAQMKANTASAFVFAGASLALVRNERTRPLAYTFASAVLLIGGLTLSQYLFGTGLGIDELLIHDTDGHAASPAPGRMGRNTALCFVLIGASLLTVNSVNPLGRVTQLGAATVSVIAFVAVLSYAFSVSRIESSILTELVTPMALHTAIAIMILALGLVLAQPKTGIIGEMRGAGAGGALLRRLIIPVVLLPSFFGYLYVRGLSASFFHSSQGAAFLVAAIVVLLVYVVRRTARALERVDGARVAGLARERAMVETTLDAVITLDSVGTILDFNGVAEEMFDLPRSEAIGQQMASLIIPERLRRDHQNGLERLRSDPDSFRSFRMETVGLRRDGSEFDIEIAVGRANESFLDDAEYVGSVRDMSERKSLEAQLRQTQKIEAVGQLAGGIAHDFNNLLTVIAGYTDLAIERIDDSPAADDLEHVKRSTQRATVLTRQLLAFSRQQLLAPASIDISGVVAGVVPMLKRLIDEDIEIIVKDRHAGSAFADRGQVEQILVNLAVNARDAMPHGGQLMIETSGVELDEQYAESGPGVAPGRYVCMSVADTGTGIASDVLDHIFEPFFTTKEVGTGTGLGLSTIHGIVAQSGGGLTVYSEVGQGTTFKVFLPATEVAPEDPVPTDAPELPWSRGSETVLLCEDEESVRRLTQRILDRAGYTVVAAATPKQALELAQSTDHRFDLLLSDVVMPEMSGIELAEKLQTIVHGIPTILISGHSTAAILNRTVLPAGSAFLEKPFSASAILKLIRLMLDRDKREVDNPGVVLTDDVVP